MKPCTIFYGKRSEQFDMIIDSRHCDWNSRNVNQKIDHLNEILHKTAENFIKDYKMKRI